MGRGLILEREPLRRPLLRQSPKTPARHAALAILSDCCSPLQGRLSTCYATVRRFTQGLPPFLARLACVKPAANVRSEPGSNSPLETFSPDRTLFSFLSRAVCVSGASSPLSLYSVFRALLAYFIWLATRNARQRPRPKFFRPSSRCRSFMQQVTSFLVSLVRTVN